MTSGKKIGLALGVVAALGLAGMGAFYSLTGDAGNGSCAAAGAATRRMEPLVRGEVAAVTLHARPQAAPPLAFTGPDGKPATLAAMKGRTLLVNLWATWCAPCLKEMPALDALQKEMGGPDFAVVAINIDTRNLDKPKAWLAENRIAALPFHADPQAATFQLLRTAHKVEGMPVSLIVDKAGCELGLIQGPADWASADAKALIGAAIGRP
ncbi:TlpA disulfide reductase family protein [Bosea sp. (in: a-proteobacteria)]|uniref:thiol:disulfide interchange protein TlpA n=1 Tax=Bosea sp. (in: a-proteobacteria) TaxID=1871050 RepID=UPI002611627C|nr:TlpA disulfide reductase family protein [Bosea sp. (in: a-proteobacteria)]MCO5091400.1 TlpA family protein disulfide reductase [Bosea sp. (in: a-proteobacteria)]